MQSLCLTLLCILCILSQHVNSARCSKVVWFRDKNLSKFPLKLVMFPEFQFSFLPQRPHGFWISIDDQPRLPHSILSLACFHPPLCFQLPHTGGSYLNQSCLGCKKQKLIHISSGRKRPIESLQGHSPKLRVGTWDWGLYLTGEFAWLEWPRSASKINTCSLAVIWKGEHGVRGLFQ